MLTPLRHYARNSPITDGKCQSAHFHTNSAAPFIITLHRTGKEKHNLGENNQDDYADYFRDHERPYTPEYGTDGDAGDSREHKDIHPHGGSNKTHLHEYD
jgi:hypothetical protein